MRARLPEKIELFASIRRKEARRRALRRRIDEDHDCDYDYGHEYENVEFVDAQDENTKRERRDFWRDNTGLLKKALLDSFNLFGQPAEHLNGLDEQMKELPSCECIKSTHQVTVCMLLGRWL
ncbi:hypothetical protein HMPREF1544_02161 [Mucor circinelloides 1006PhL]|uniref:Uncharacterized protein n=1 Tax=Mucor circinelloides f. circinelloides (strain 1006PhL) TaxID=1220926 RepID=S2JLU7_MUCC1|nr:hypothetical protein HMPREF1544_02161 [Mucor circinelloides 1006PhL]